MVCIFLTFDRSFATAVFPPRQNPNEVRHCARLIENVGEYTSKDTNKREQKQTRLHFAEREYFGASQSTNKRGQCQIYLNIAEREYLRRSQRYEKSGAEANYFQFCLTRTEHPRRNRRQKVRSYRPQRTSSGRTPPSIPRTGDKRATTTAYGRAASGGRRIRTVRNRRQQDAGT